MSATFELHPRLAADTVPVATGPLSRLLLMQDANFPWLILVPQRPGLRDLHDLAADDMALAMREIVAASRTLEDRFAPDKINVAALGNMVPQLHIHVIARFETDPAWPKPVWGVLPPKPYEIDDLEAWLESLEKAFTENL